MGDSPVAGDSASTPRPSIVGGARQGLRAGGRRALLAGVPLGLVLVCLALAPTAFGLGAGRGFGLHRGMGIAIAFVPAVALLGGGIGVIGGAIRRARPQAPRASGPSWLRRNRFRLAVATGLAILAASVGVGAYAGRRVARELAEAIAAADREDPHWRIADMLAHREAVPDSENSAPTVARVAAMLPQGWPDDAAGPPPDDADPERPDLGAALERLAALEPRRSMEDRDVAAIRSELETRREALTLARTVASLPRGWHELVLGPNVVDTRLQETQDARKVARLLEADAALRAHDGDADRAMDSCLAILNVARSIGDEPFLISCLARAALDRIALGSALRVLGQGEPSDEALARFQGLVRRERADNPFLRGVRCERATMDETIRRLASGEMSADALAEGAGPSGGGASVAPWGAVLLDHQRALGLKWTGGLVEIAGLPPYRRGPLWRAWEQEIDQANSAPLSRYTATLPLMLLPALEMSERALTRRDIELGAAEILLAAERRRRRDGAWPGSLAALAADLGPDPPLDPSTGEPFRLLRGDGRFLVYSVGPNGRDEQGETAPLPRRHDAPDDDGAAAWDPPLRHEPPPAVPPKPAPAPEADPEP